MTSKNALEVILDSAMRRTMEADPKNGRCLIENCSQTKAIQVAHVFDRNHGKKSRKLDALEWCWGMVRGTLNLDTRRNIFFLGAALQELYTKRKWVLLPERQDVLNYINEDVDCPRERSDYRDAEGDFFRYRFIPIRDMEDIYLTRQYTENDEQRVAIHHYPFDDFPVLKSHIHPRFVILHLGEVITNVGAPIKSGLFARYPWLEQVQDIYYGWSTSLPSNAYTDPSYKHKKFSGYKDPSTIIDSELHNTPPRRLQTIFPPTPPSMSPYGHLYYDLSSGSEESSIQSTFVLKPNHRKRPASSEADETHPAKKQRFLTLTPSTLDALEGVECGDGLEGRVTKWVQGCSPTTTTSSAQSVAPPTSKPLLRRSARLRARLQKKA